MDDFGASDEFGSFTFNGMFSGNAFADFCWACRPRIKSSLPDRFSYNSPSISPSSAQDEWHISKSLTFSYGLRWELQPPFPRQNGNIANFNPATGGLVVPDIALQMLPPHQASCMRSTLARLTRCLTRHSPVRLCGPPARQAIPNGCGTLTTMISILAQALHGVLSVTTRLFSVPASAFSPFQVWAGKPT